MDTLIAKLPAFALPFVTRSLRGGRGRRYLVFSTVLAGLTLLIGLWIALGRGNFEHEIRVDTGLEFSERVREQREFVLFAHDEWIRDELQQTLADDALRDFDQSSYTPGFDPGYDPGYDYDDGTNPYYDLPYASRRVVELRRAGHALLLQAVMTEPRSAEQRALQAQALALLPQSERAFAGQQRWFSDDLWSTPSRVETLERVVAVGGEPQVVDYSSPLGLREVLMIAGMVAGLALLALGTVFAPLLVAVQQAQERHENTLLPLTGTALSPRELAVGLACGPLSVVAIFAAPQLLLFAAGTLAGGHPAAAGAMLLVLAASMLTLVFGAQLLGHLVGKRRTPGIVGISLMLLAFATWMTGATLAFEINRDIKGFAALLPHIGLTGLYGASWTDLNHHAGYMLGAAGANAIGCVIMGWLLLSALARKIEGREGPLLRRGEALVGALVCIGLTNLSIPLHVDEPEIRQYIGLAILALPLALLLMGRVPAGDGPSRLRRVELPKLLGEFSAWVAAHILTVVLFFGVTFEAFHPVALGWLAWSVLVLGLIAVRVVAVPGRIAANLWTGFCGLGLIVGYVHAMVWSLDHHHDIEDVFAFFELSPVLGLLQIALVVWIPISLIRAMRSELKAIS